jgi:hypothetical protein
MTDQFAFLGDKQKAVFAATILAVLLLLPASLGFGGTIIQEAFGQFNLPLLEEDTEETEDEDGGLVVEDEETTTTTTTTPTPPATTSTFPATTTTDLPDPATYVLAPVNTEPLRGFIGNTLPTQGAGGAAIPADGSGYIVTGRSRIFANDSGIETFLAGMYISAIDGSAFHNITIREGEPHRFEVTAGNESTAASASVTGNIFLNGSPTPVIENVPMTLTVRGQTLALENLDIDEASITDTAQRDILRIIDGQSLYGTFPRE